VPDPAEDLPRYHRITARKRAELHAALTAGSGKGRPAARVAPGQIFSVASDPHQIAGPNLEVDAATFYADRGWDGFDELRAALGDLHETLSVNAVDVTVLCGGLTRLAGWRAELRDEHARGEERVRQLDGLGAEILRRGQTGRAIATDRAALLGRLLSDFALSLVVAAAEQEQGGQEKLAERIENLPTDEELAEIVAQWQRATADQVAAWCAEARDGLSLRVQRRSFAAAFPDDPGSVDTGTLRSPGQRQNRAAIAEVVNVIGKLASYAGKARAAGDAAAGAAGAAARASLLARFGLALQGAAMAWDAYELVQEALQERVRAREQARLRREVDEVAHAWADTYVAEDEALTELSDVLQALGQAHTDITGQADQEREAVAAVSDRISRCTDLMTDARRLLRSIDGGRR
jgi:hypothetical protein